MAQLYPETPALWHCPKGLSLRARGLPLPVCQPVVVGSWALGGQSCRSRSTTAAVKCPLREEPVPPSFGRRSLHKTRSLKGLGERRLLVGSRAREPGEVTQVRPVLSLKASSWKSGGQDSGWPGSSRHSDSSSITGQMLPGHSRSCFSSSFLPPHPHFASAHTCSNSVRPSLLDGSRGLVGQLGKNTMEECRSQPGLNWPTMSLSTISR